MIDTRNNLPDMSDAYAKVVEEGKKKTVGKTMTVMESGMKKVM